MATQQYDGSQQTGWESTWGANRYPGRRLLGQILRAKTCRIQMGFHRRFAAFLANEKKTNLKRFFEKQLLFVNKYGFCLFFCFVSRIDSIAVFFFAGTNNGCSLKIKTETPVKALCFGWSKHLVIWCFQNFSSADVLNVTVVVLFSEMQRSPGKIGKQHLWTLAVRRRRMVLWKGRHIFVAGIYFINNSSSNYYCNGRLDMQGVFFFSCKKWSFFLFKTLGWHSMKY